MPSAKSQRRVIAVSGDDRIRFLQDLVTNDVAQVKEGLVYAALLTPQGKLLYDFFLSEQGDRILIDVAEGAADALLKRLSLYKLRSKVALEDTDLQVHRGLGRVPDDGLMDPRDHGLGWRAYRTSPQVDDQTDWDALRVALTIPEFGEELVSGDSYILELDFERLNGVDFRKGCYVGQEVTARMHHKTTLKKGLRRVSVSGPVPSGTEILAGDRAVGTVFTQSGGEGLAYLRFDRISDDMTAGEAKVTVLD